jgi:hypothetical protein
VKHGHNGDDDGACLHRRILFSIRQLPALRPGRVALPTSERAFRSQLAALLWAQAAFRKA